MKNINPSFFIIGPERSGTTLLRLMLNSHPDICIPPETYFIVMMHRFIHENKLDIKKDMDFKIFINKLFENKWFIRSFSRYVKKEKTFISRLFKHKRDEKTIYNALYTEYMQKAGKRIIGDKTPYYTRYLDIIYGIFPTAKFIYIMRDGRAAYDSLLKAKFIVEKNDFLLAKRWKMYAENMCMLELKKDIKIIKVKYENLLLDCKEALIRICNFLDIKYDEKMMDFYKTARNEIPAEELKLGHHKKLFTPLDKHSRNNWRKELSMNQILLFELINGNYLRKFRYPIIYSKANIMRIGFVKFFIQTYLSYIKKQNKKITPLFVIKKIWNLIIKLINKKT